VRNRLAIIAVTLALALLPSCSEQAPRSGGPESRSPRVVALSPALAIILRDLSLEDRIVGRHAFDETLHESIPVVGDQSGIDYEALARVEPTHVFLEWGARELPPRLVRIAADRGWTLESLPMLSLGDVRSATIALATKVGGPDAAGRADELIAQMDAAWSPDPGLAARAGRTLPLFWTDPPGAAGPGSFHVQMLESMGVPQALTEGAAYIELDPERLRRLDPDSLILFMPGADPERIEELLGPLARLDLRAVETGRFAVIVHPLALSPSTALIEVAQDVRAAVQAWPLLEDAPAASD